MKISLITAVYNSEKTVAHAMRSVAEQNHPDVEHVIIEGASRDGSLEVIRSKQNDRMVLVSEPDKGIYDALNKGIAKASGDMIGLVHSDDYLANAKVRFRKSRRIIIEIQGRDSIDSPNYSRNTECSSPHPQCSNRFPMPAPICRQSCRPKNMTGALHIS